MWHLSATHRAEKGNLGSLQFKSVFTAEPEASAANALENLRLEAARPMVERSRPPMDLIAKELGLNDGTYLCRYSFADWVFHHWRLKERYRNDFSQPAWKSAR